MSDIPVNDDVVAIDGKRYSRLMAEEVARDIELLATIAPNAWAIADNSSLHIDKPAMLSFAEPIEHAYLFDGEALNDESVLLVKQYGQPAAYAQFPDLFRIHMPQWDASSLASLRLGHEGAIRKVATIAPGLSPIWKWHNLARMQDLEHVVGRSLPQPAYLDELLAWREREPDSSDLSGSKSFPQIDPELLEQVALGIEVAHDVHPDSWSVYALKSGLAFNVSGYTAAFIAKERGTWMLAGDPGDSRFEEIAPLRKKTGFAGVPDFQVFADERTQLKAIAVTYGDEFLAAVRNLAAYTTTVTPRSADFQPHLVEQLAKAVGRELPRPEYASRSTVAHLEHETVPPVHIEHVEGRRYWKVDCGSKGAEWPEMVESGRVWHANWASEPIHLDQLPTDHDAFVADMIQHQGIAEPAADHCWRFMHEMSVGDLMVAINSNRAYGWGELAGDYEYVEEENRQHQRAAEWTELTPPYQIANMSQSLKDATWGIGPRELTFEQFAEAIGSDTHNNGFDGIVAGRFTGFDETLLNLLAQDIEEAHETNPNSWALGQLNTGELRLYVHRQVVLQFTADQGTFVLSGRPDDPRLVALRPDVSEERAAGSEAFIFEHLDIEAAKQLLDDFQGDHAMAVLSLADKVRDHANWARFHKPELIERLSAAVGRDLPQPGYWEKPGVPNLDPLPTIRNCFAASGLHYTDAQIATFYTALQTKGFVVLSGISGTGKSKIATGFVEMLPGHTVVIEVGPSSANAAALSFELSATQTWVAIPASQSSLFPPIDENDRRPVTIDFDGHGYLGSIILRTLNQGKPTLYLSMGSSLTNALRETGSSHRFFATLDLDDSARTVTHVAITNRPGVLGGAALEPDAEETRTNHLFLSVRPDWRDSTSLLGYYNPLTETYEWTDFLKFIIQAGENYKGPVEDRIAWFVILDEMNLAHVEYYFADLLSVLESGRDADGWTSEPVRTSYPDALEDDVPPRELRLPPNLYVIGTVNMDETTHAFSPKVLDRAFTIELTEVDFASYDLGGGMDAATAMPEADKAALLRAFSREGRFVRIDKGGDIAGVVDRHPVIRDHLQTLNLLLRRDRFHFGYRVFDEICQYLAINDEHEMMPFAAAFDQAVLMKVLPKFSGSRARLRSPLLSVLAWAFYPGTAAEMRTSVITSFESLLGEDLPNVEGFAAGAAYPVVAGRVTRMLLTLEQDGFVSFG